MVWAVESGSAADANSMQALNLFQIQGDSESYVFDIYLDTEGEFVFGWDLTLLANSVGLLGNVAGNDLGVGGAQPGGYRQFGGDGLAEQPLNSDSILLMTITWAEVDGVGVLDIGAGSALVDGNFNTVFLPSQTLATVGVSVPLPASFYLFFASLFSLVVARKKRANSYLWA